MAVIVGSRVDPTFILSFVLPPVTGRIKHTLPSLIQRMNSCPFPRLICTTLVSLMWNKNLREIKRCHRVSHSQHINKELEVRLNPYGYETRFRGKRKNSTNFRKDPQCVCVCVVKSMCITCVDILLYCVVPCLSVCLLLTFLCTPSSSVNAINLIVFMCLPPLYISVLLLSVSVLDCYCCLCM